MNFIAPLCTVFTDLRARSDEQDHSEISKFSKRDADAYFRYEAQLQKFRKFMDFVLDSPTPEIPRGGASTADWLRYKLQRSKFWAQCMGHTLSLGQACMV